MEAITLAVLKSHWKILGRKNLVLLHIWMSANKQNDSGQEEELHSVASSSFPELTHCPQMDRLEAEQACSFLV